MNRIAFFVCAMLTAPLSLAGDISGVWKHADEPGWIEISLDEGSGTVVRNDKICGEARSMPKNWASTRTLRYPCRSLTSCSSRSRWAS
jgi:hypothetical protein